MFTSGAPVSVGLDVTAKNVVTAPAQVEHNSQPSVEKVTPEPAHKSGERQHMLPVLISSRATAMIKALDEWNGSLDTFPRELEFSAESERKLEKYEAKIALLKLGSEIKKTVKAAAEKAAILAKAEEESAQIIAQAEILAQKLADAVTSHNRNVASIGELEAPPVPIAGTMSSVEKLKARKKELQISKLKTELLETEIKVIEAEVAVDEKNAEAEVALKHIEEVRFAAGDFQFQGLRMKDQYKEMCASWAEKFGDDASSESSQSGLDNNAHTGSDFATDQETVFGAHKEELLNALAQIETLTNTNCILEAAALRDAEKIGVLRALEVALNGSNNNSIARAASLDEEISILKSAAFLNTRKIAELEDEKAAELLRVDSLTKELVALRLTAQAAAAEIDSLKESQTNLKKDLANALVRVEKAEILNKEYEALKLSSKAAFDEVRSLKAAEANAKIIEKKSDALAEAQAAEIISLKAALLKFSTDITPTKSTTDPETLENNTKALQKTVAIPTIARAGTTAVANANATTPTAAEYQNLKDLVTVMKPLFAVGRDVRVRHNMVQLHNKMGKRYSVDKARFSAGYESVNSGRAVEDATIYLQGAKHCDQASGFVGIYGMPAQTVWQHRNFSIFIHILNMGVDMKVYTPAYRYGFNNTGFQSCYQKVMGKVCPSPSKLAITSDEAFNMHSDLVFAYNRMRSERDDVFRARGGHNIGRLEKKFFEAAWHPHEASAASNEATS
ncbi:uncharacterized protein L3040_007086 [Drepanopeziza brunnea f. sp. 'multigermtubi']|uniref:uncharacterized protein n=1 Tax=Drepanopeziza brunnea f. sp. 'multigermtubi' TaxID=698441 RepID=UPI00238387F0|nr:hypothetical protein L3040_007086 [Drepanopeziza brunnea f. sp. 'multigermtubi']